MAQHPPIKILVGDVVEGADLVERLARHGFPARLVEDQGRSWVEVSSSSEEPRHLLDDLMTPLEAWLRDSEKAELMLWAGDNRYTLNPPLRDVRS